jgi:transcriptional regulator with XRE-family HTH domain
MMARKKTKKPRARRFDGERLRSLRVARGWNVPMFSYRTGVSEASLWKYEEGLRVPGGENLTRICNTLGIQSSEFLLDL